jgi:MFS superfamily sulfate permease-like transporter
VFAVFKFSAAIPGIVYALLGSSRQLNVAPEAALSLLVGQAVSDILLAGTIDRLSGKKYVLIFEFKTPTRLSITQKR